MGIPQGKGFEIAVDVTHHILRCRLWGEWGLDLARNYKYALLEKMNEVHRNGDDWYVLADFKALYPVSDEVQHLIREYFTVARAQGMQQIVYVGERTRICRRLDRIFEGSSSKSSVFVDSEEQAMQWLLQHESGAKTC